MKSSTFEVLELTQSTTVVGVDDEEADNEELKASPHNVTQQGAASGACTQLGVDRQGDGRPHDEHKPGGTTNTHTGVEKRLIQTACIAFVLPH